MHRKYVHPYAARKCTLLHTAAHLKHARAAARTARSAQVMLRPRPAVVAGGLRPPAKKGQDARLEGQLAMLFEPNAVCRQLKIHACDHDNVAFCFSVADFQLDCRWMGW